MTGLAIESPCPKLTPHLYHYPPSPPFTPTINFSDALVSHALTHNDETLQIHLLGFGIPINPPYLLCNDDIS